MEEICGDQVVTLNVGGKTFQSRVETLARAEYFRNQLASPHWKPADLDRPIFVDRCPKLFVHVLRSLRDDRYELPEECVPELDFYGIERCVSIAEEIPSIEDFSINTAENECLVPLKLSKHGIQLGNLLCRRAQLSLVELHVGGICIATISGLQETFTCFTVRSIHIDRLVDALNRILREGFAQLHYTYRMQYHYWYVPEKVELPVKLTNCGTSMYVGKLCIPDGVFFNQWFLENTNAF